MCGFMHTAPGVVAAMPPKPSDGRAAARPAQSICTLTHWVIPCASSSLEGRGTQRWDAGPGRVTPGARAQVLCDRGYDADGGGNHYLPPGGAGTAQSWPPAGVRRVHCKFPKPHRKYFYQTQIGPPSRHSLRTNRHRVCRSFCLCDFEEVYSEWGAKSVTVCPATSKKIAAQKRAARKF